MGTHMGTWEDVGTRMGTCRTRIGEMGDTGEMGTSLGTREDMRTRMGTWGHMGTRIGEIGTSLGTRENVGTWMGTYRDRYGGDGDV